MFKPAMHRIEAELKDAGYWYPPDAIAATLEGRDTYTAMGGEQVYNLTGMKRGVIQAAIDRAKRP